MGSYRYPHTMVTMLSWFLFNLSYRVAVAQYCFSRAIVFSTKCRYLYKPNSYLRYPSTGCAFPVSPLPLSSLSVPVYFRYHSLCLQQSLSRHLDWHHQPSNGSLWYSCPVFTNGLCFLTCRTSAMLMRFNIAAVNKFPLPNRIKNQRLETLNIGCLTAMHWIFCRWNSSTPMPWVSFAMDNQPALDTAYLLPSCVLRLL